MNTNMSIKPKLIGLKFLEPKGRPDFHGPMESSPTLQAWRPYPIQPEQTTRNHGPSLRPFWVKPQAYSNILKDRNY